jgi:hypothetical protein
MEVPRTPLLLSSVLAAILLSAAHCAPDPVCEEPCTLTCELGLKRDLEGRTYCECREAGFCIQVLSAPHRNPATLECVTFPTPCDVPGGWEPCEPGCEIQGSWVAVGDSAPAGDGCNTCTCLSPGHAACTEIACPACEHDGLLHPLGSLFSAGDGCNTCLCLAGGAVTCTERACPECPPSAQKLCERTGGRWDERSCGHYVCGRPPLCDAIIPGCDCGSGRSFVAGAGCVEDRTCGECQSDADCPAGSACNACPIDPSCPLCAVCGPPVCEPRACAFDPDCPPGSHCEGSSVCPPDVVCVWEGEPGVCVPDRCCDPSLEPGAGDNPFCFEGASCCANGEWACNQGDGSPSCVTGPVCP